MTKNSYEPDWSIGLPVYPSLREVLGSKWLRIVHRKNERCEEIGLASHDVTIVNTRYVSRISPSLTYVSKPHIFVCEFYVEVDTKKLGIPDGEWVVLVDQESGYES